MDPMQVKAVSWWLCLGCGALALIALGVAAAGRRTGAFGWARAPAFALVVSALLAVAALAVLSCLPPGTGARGAAAAFALGVMVAPLGLLVAALRHPVPASDESPPPILLPGIFITGAVLLAMGIVSHRYGIRAMVPWEALLLGLGCGLAAAVLALRSLTPWEYAEALASALTGATVAAAAVVWTAALACAHFDYPSTAPWFALYCGAGLVAGWTLALVAAALVGRGSGTRSAAVAAAAVLAVALAAAGWSAQQNILRDPHLLPCLAAGLLAALVTLSASAGEEQKPPGSLVRATGDASTVASVTLVFVTVGLAWAGFKIWLGLGIAASALGYLAAFPVAAALGSRTRRPERLVTLAGGGVLLLAGMKVYQHVGRLMLSGIDLSDGNVTVALVLGMALPVVLEALFGRRPRHERASAQTIPAAANALGRLLGSLLVAGAGVVGGALYFGPDGLAAMFVGMAGWSILTAAGAAGAADDDGGFFAFRSLPLALGMVALGVLLVPFRDHLTLVSRQQKLQILGSVAIVAALALALAGALSRRTPAHAPRAADPSAPPPTAATPPHPAASVEPVGTGPGSDG